MPCVAAEHRQRPANATVGVRERGSEWQLSNLDPKSWKEQRKIYEKIQTVFDKSETRHTHTHAQRRNDVQSAAQQLRCNARSAAHARERQRERLREVHSGVSLSA